jgi:hypothetical protein
MGQSFLSVIVDRNSHSYDWFVPHILGQYWESPKRVVMEDLSTNIKYYSADFLVPGITLTMNSSTSDLLPDTLIPLSWSSNDDSQFSLHLMKDNTIVNTINNGSLFPNSSYIWEVPSYQENLLQILIQSMDRNTFAFSDYFNIIDHSTTITTTPYNNTPTEPTNYHIGWYLILFIIVLSIGCLGYLIYKLTPYYLGIENSKVYPNTRNMVNPVYERQSAIGRPLPPLPNYVIPPIRNTRRRSQSAEYNVLERNNRDAIQNEIYYEHNV